MKKIFCALFVTANSFSLGLSANLLEVYHQALKSDPTFQSAKATYFSAMEAYPQAVANILPRIGLGAGINYDQIDVITTLPNAPLGRFHLRGYNYDLSVSQPVVDFASWFQIGTASFQVKQAAATYASAAQNLLLRVSTAYFNVLQTEDTLRFTQAEKRANARQLDQAQQKFKVGLDAITSVYDAQASFDDVAAREIAAENNVINSREQLRQITGIYYKHLAKLKGTVPLLSPRPKHVETWVNKGSRYNFDLQSSSFAMMAARQQIKVNFSGHLPVVDFTGNIIRTRNGNARTLIPSATNRRLSTVGLQLNVPLFTGGAISSQVRQAQQDYANAVSQRELTHRQVSVQIRQTYNSVISGISKIKADKQAIISRKASLDSTEAALKVGTRTIVDLLQAQQQLFQSQTTLAQDQYEYINNTLLLKQLSGTLTFRDIIAINTWLVGGQQHASHLSHGNRRANPYKIPVQSQKLVISGHDAHHAQRVVNHITHKTTQKSQPVRVKPAPKPVRKTFKTSKITPIQAKAFEPKGYTIQLLGNANKHALQQFVAQHKLNKAKVLIYKTKRHGQPWYTLFYGEFSHSRSAQRVLRQLPADARMHQPWVRRLPKANNQVRGG